MCRSVCAAALPLAKPKTVWAGEPTVQGQRSEEEPPVRSTGALFSG